MELVPVTTASFRTRHLARPEDLKTHPTVPGRAGDSLCRTNNLGGVLDHERGLHFLRRYQPLAEVDIETLPLCKRCAKTAGRVL